MTSIQDTGSRLWSTDLYLPSCKPGKYGDWAIRPGGQLVHDRGYHSGNWLVAMLPSLVRRVRSSNGSTRWEMWMSLTPHEIESQEAGCRHAFGHTVIMGLGMGWVAANAALNPDVTKVTVVELDPAVASLLELSEAFASLDDYARAKIEIVEADACQWGPPQGDTVNFLYADIWRDLAEPQCLAQVRQMQRNVNADTVYFWGQEIALYSAFVENAAGGAEFTTASLQRAAEQVIGLPLLLPHGAAYPVLIERVIANRETRGLRVTQYRDTSRKRGWKRLSRW